MFNPIGTLKSRNDRYRADFGTRVVPFDPSHPYCAVLYVDNVIEETAHSERATDMLTIVAEWANTHDLY